MAKIATANFNLEKERAEQSNTDWVFGALSKPGIVSIPEAERDLYLPIGETQFDDFADFTDCASRSPVNHLEALFTYHYRHDMKPENKKWMEEKGYVTNDKITFSDRYVAVGSGTTHAGNSLKAPIDFIHSNGLVPKKLLPKTDDLTWDAYYAPISQNLKDLGQQFLKRFSINYEQVFIPQFASVLKDDCIGVAAYAWPTPVGGVYLRSNLPFNHAFLLYKLPPYQIFDNYLDIDAQNEHIEGDFTKNLAPDYAFFDYGYRVYISAETVPLTDDQVNIQLTVFQTLLQYGLLAFFAKWWIDFFKKDTEPPQQHGPVIIPPQVPPQQVNRIHDWALAIVDFESGGDVNAANYRRNNPGNIKDTNGNFMIFTTWEVGMAYLENYLERACTGKHRAYKPNMTLLQFFHVYAPDGPTIEGNYASFVAKKLGVFPSVRISTLGPLPVGGLTPNMNFMDNLIQVRIKAFIIQLVGIAVTAVLGYLASPEFATVVTTHFGESATVSLVLLIITGVISHVRNLGQVKAFGATGQTPIIL